MRFENGAVAERRQLNIPSTLAWIPRQWADFDADGDDDLLVQHADNGRWRLFEINNFQSPGNTFPNIIRNPRFQIRNDQVGRN